MDRLDLEPAWWSRNSGDLNEEVDLLDPAVRAAQEHRAQDAPVVHLSPQPTVHLPLTCATLLLATDPLSSTFLRAAFFPPSSASSKAAPVLLASFALSPTSSPPSASTSRDAASEYSVASFYSLPGEPSTVLGLQYAEVAAHAMTQWAEELFRQVVQPKRVVVLDCAPLSSFVSTASSTPDPPLLFALQTSASPPLPAPLRPLPPPNLLHSLASAVLVHCELEALPATLLVSYASPHFIAESLSAYGALQPLLVGSSLLGPMGGRAAAAAWKETGQGLSRVRGGTGKGVGGAASSLLHGPNPDLFV